MGQIIGTLILTEMMINPAGVGRANGTWFEFYNPTNTNVVVVNASDFALHNDQDLQLLSKGIPDGLIIPPGGYYVIGRSSSVDFNGGVTTNLTYAQGMNVSEMRGRVRFFAFNQPEVVNVEWKNSSFPFQAGASLTYNVSAFPANGTDADSGFPKQPGQLVRHQCDLWQRTQQGDSRTRQYFCLCY
jgi:hypothetical protein